MRRAIRRDDGDSMATGSCAAANRLFLCIIGCLLLHRFGGRAPFADVLGPDDAVCVVESPRNVCAKQRLLVALLNAVRRATGVTGFAVIPEALAAALAAIRPQEGPPLVSRPRIESI